MRKKETKIISLFIILGLIVFAQTGFATDFTSANFTVTNSVIDAGASSSSSANFGLGQSLSQTAIGKSTSTNFQLWSGFQYFFKVNPNTLSATAGNTQVQLSWTVPQGFLGITIAGYEVGTGTISGSYTFQDVGNVTTFTKTGLTNGTPYFFKIKAYALGGTVLTFSNEVSATPTGGSSGGGGGGGGGGPVLPPPPPPPPTGNGTIDLSGLAYPGVTVTVLRDGQVAANTIADPGAGFHVSMSGLGSGTYQISIYAVDQNNRRSPSLSFPATITAGVTVTVNNLFLGPTIGLSHEQIKKGDSLSIFGYTVPDSDITLTVHSPDEFISQIRSNTTGAYFKAFDTSVLELGDHTGKTQAATVSLVSPFSDTASFKVADSSIETPIDNCKRSDLNCDTKINLTDFSILLFYWNQHNPGNPRTDINKSGVVDLTDFSIMLYDWTG